MARGRWTLPESVVQVYGELFLLIVKINILSAFRYVIFALFYPNCRYVDDRQNSPVFLPILQQNSPVFWRQQVHMYDFWQFQGGSKLSEN